MGTNVANCGMGEGRLAGALMLVMPRGRPRVSRPGMHWQRRKTNSAGNGMPLPPRPSLVVCDLWYVI